MYLFAVMSASAAYSGVDSDGLLTLVDDGTCMREHPMKRILFLPACFEQSWDITQPYLVSRPIDSAQGTVRFKTTRRTLSTGNPSFLGGLRTEVCWKLMIRKHIASLICSLQLTIIVIFVAYWTA